MFCAGGKFYRCLGAVTFVQRKTSEGFLNLGFVYTLDKKIREKRYAFSLSLSPSLSLSLSLSFSLLIPAPIDSFLRSGHLRRFRGQSDGGHFFRRRLSKIARELPSS